MMRTQFLNNFNKDKENRQAYKKQQFFYVKLSKTVNKKFYNNPDGKKITDKIFFGKQVRPNFNIKHC